jgi:hypothetical protein
MQRPEPNERARRALLDELRETVGDEAVERADVDVDRVLAEQDGRPAGELQRSRLLLAVAAAVGVAVAVAIALALQSWWVLVPLLALHATVTAIVVRTVFKASSNVEKPAPTTQAMLEEEGVADPEGALNDLVEQTADRAQGSRAERTLRRREDRADPDGDRAGEVARQQESWTPDSPSRRSRSV